MFSFTASISDDKTSVALQMPAHVSMTGDELEVFMNELAVIRANMKPPRPDQDPTPASVLSSVPCNRWFATLDPEAPTQIRLFLQHLGFGWVWISLTETGVAEVTRTLRRLLNDRPKLS